ncbi:MAG: vWA domain-containing protein [Phascolarctobacterium sp.]|nr:vWA domain-containing protein [Phascolarctobacterium sp.]
MENKVTEIVFVIDRSGSMTGLESDTIGGYNSFLNKQKQGEGEALISTVLFDHEMLVLHDRVNIKDVELLTDADYEPRGCTALLDAVGGAIHHIGNVHKYARKEDVPAKTIFVIITDGMENASKRYSYKRVQQMIERQKERYGWEFVFLGANMDAAKEAGHFGISAKRAMTYRNDSRGVKNNYEELSQMMFCVRSCAAAPCASMDDESMDKAFTQMKERIESDAKKRSK